MGQGAGVEEADARWFGAWQTDRGSTRSTAIGATATLDRTAATSGLATDDGSEVTAQKQVTASQIP